MVCRRSCWGSFSRCRTLPLVYLRAHGAATTSLQCCVDFIGYRSRDEWSLRLRVLYTNRLLQRRRCTCLQTSISPPSMVASFAHLYTDHSLFHGPAPPLVTEVLLLQDRVCGTVCRPLFDRLPTMDSLSDIWSHIYLGPRNHGASWPWFFAPYKYTYLLYLLTYL